MKPFSLGPDRISTPWISSGIARRRNKTSRSTGSLFEEAVAVFYDSLATSFPDSAHSTVELRFITFGYSARDRLLVVAHAERGETVRIISARLTTALERSRYEAQNPR
ncbi:MAG: BrnT family toxin [Burkholderiales bacterium]